MPRSRPVVSAVTRREFARLFALGGSAALFAHPAWARDVGAPRLPVAPPASEVDWEAVRAQFVMPPWLAVMNAANLCPAPRPVVEALVRETERVDRDPSPANRAGLSAEKERTREVLAALLRVSPEEIILTRNTSEANNLVSSGLDLGPGDEVVVHADNHPSNLLAWQAKAKRFGYTVVAVPARSPHPGPEELVAGFERAITPRTKVLAFTHLSNTVGDLFPATAICRMARARGVLTLVDGAQSFGLLDVDLAEMQPDFYTGSAHKWPCGARECGVLYVNARVQDRLWPSIYSAYPGAVGFSRTFEGFGQRDEATLIAFREALEFQMRIGRAAIEARARGLASQLVDGLATLPGVTVWTSPDPARRAAVVSFQPGSLAPGRLAAALYERDGIGVATRGGTDRGGIRVSPHFYNSPAEIERLLAALHRYLKTGV